MATALPDDSQLWEGTEADTTGWPGLESMSCDHCGAAGSKLLRCSVCRMAIFCNQQCQRAAWPQHRSVCGRRPAADERPASVPGSPASSAPGSPRTPGVAKDALRKGVEAFRERRFRESLQRAEEAAAASLPGHCVAEGVCSEEALAELRCEALRLRGQCFEQLADLTRAKEALAEALGEAKARLSGAARAKAEANALLRLGAVAARSSVPGIAVQYQRKAISLLEADGREKDVLAAAYNNLGISATRHGLEDAAQRAFERACALRTETGNTEGLCACSTNLANLLRSRGRPAEAAQSLEKARTMALDSKSVRLERQVLVNLANLYENELLAPEAQEAEPDTAAAAPAELPTAAAPATALEEEPPLVLAPAEAAARALRCRRALLGLSEQPPLQPESRCGGCGLDLRAAGSKQLLCTRCRGSLYCSAACQRQAWPEHSQKCRAPSAEELALRAQTCPICLDGLGLLSQTRLEAPKIVILECMHCLHTACWEDCQKARGGVCPVCRSTLEFSV